jgi:hypothetical protein
MYKTINTEELKNLKSFLQLDQEKFESELTAIDQELTVRSIPECRPLADKLKIMRNNE